MEKLTNEQKVAKATELSSSIEYQKKRLWVINSALELNIPKTEVYASPGANYTSRTIEGGLGEADDALLKFIQRSYLQQLRDLYSARLERFQKEFDALWKN